MGFVCSVVCICIHVEWSWNVMAHTDARAGKWRGNCRMQWVASTLHTTSEHAVSSITTADARTSAANSPLKWRPPANLNGLVRLAARSNLFFFCACAITFQMQSTAPIFIPIGRVNLWLLLRYCLVTTWLLPGYCLVTDLFFPGYYLVTTCLLPFYYLVTSWLLPG